MIRKVINILLIIYTKNNDIKVYFCFLGESIVKFEIAVLLDLFRNYHIQKL